MPSVPVEYKRITRQIYAGRNPIQGAIRVFSSLPVSTLNKYLTRLLNEPIFNAAFGGTLMPQKINILNKCGHMPYFADDIDRTLLWTFAVFRKNQNNINFFLHLQRQYSHCFLQGDFKQCQNLLDAIHNEFGYSVWELERRIFLTGKLDNNDSQDIYTRGLLQQMEEGSIDRYHLFCFNRQCKKNVTPSSFLSLLESDFQRFRATGLSDIFCRYLQHTLTKSALPFADRHELWTPEDICLALYCDDKNSLIDRFLGFKSLACAVFSQHNKQIQQAFAPIVSSLSEFIQDEVLSNLSFLSQYHYPLFHTFGCDSVIQAVDAYTVGNYESCLQLTGRLLQGDISYFPLVDLYAKCCVFKGVNQSALPQDCPLNEIVQKLIQLYMQKGDMKELQRDLLQLAYTHLDESWSRELLLLTEKYANKLCALESPMPAAIYSAISLPSILFSFDSQYVNDFLAGASDTFRSSLSVRMACAVRNQDHKAVSLLPIDKTRKKKYVAALLMERDPSQAVQIINSLLQDPAAAPALLELTSMQIDGYLRCGELLNAMESFVRVFLQVNFNIVYYGHADQIFQALRAGNDAVLGSILSPISCNIYLTYFADGTNRNDNVLHACYEDYLESQGVDTPSQLLVSRQVENISLYEIYFFSKVCVPNVMDRSLAFRYSDDVLKERIVICTYLTVLDPGLQQEYTDEIHRLTNTLMIGMKKREVETSKIYTDIAGIKLLLTKNLSELFDRYVSVKKMNLEEQVRRILSTLFDESDTASSANHVVYLTPDSMLENILKQARDIFVADNKYGLDGYLSVRIRHGTLESQLRSCFERLSLITTKGIDGIYQPNPVWMRTVWLPSDTENSINETFARFSCSIDKMIHHIKKDLIQIKTEEKNPQGLFDFTIDPNYVSKLDAHIGALTSFDEFEAMFLKDLLDITELSLSHIRELLTSDINMKFQAMLNTLETDLEQYSDWLNYRELRNKIATARTEISKELKTIAEWFRLTRPDSFQDYSLSHAVGVSCSIMESFSSSIHYEQHVDPNIQLKGSTLPSVVDIFNTLLDNVIKHSSGSTPRSANITISQAEKAVDICIQNQAKLTRPELEHLDEIISHLSEWEKKGGISREGGSGLLKVKKILSVDLRCNSKITYSYENKLFTLFVHAELGDVLL